MLETAGTPATSADQKRSRGRTPLPPMPLSELPAPAGAAGAGGGQADDQAARHQRRQEEAPLTVLVSERSSVWRSLMIAMRY